jgi:cytochrome c553
MRLSITALASVAMASLAGSASAASPGSEEHAAIAAYEGTRTCAGCHEKQVNDVVTSLHYQHQAPAPFLVTGQQAKNAGMMVSY